MKNYQIVENVTTSPAPLLMYLFEIEWTQRENVIRDIQIQHIQFCKNNREFFHTNVEQRSMFYISAHAKYTPIFKKTLQYSRIWKYICHTCTNLTTTYF